MRDDELGLDLYLEVLAECYETVRETTVEGIAEIAEYEVEKWCDEVVGQHEMVGDIDSPQINVAVIALSTTREAALEDTDPDASYESGAEYLADLAHTTAKYDLISWVLDRQAETERDENHNIAEVSERQ